MKISDIPAVNKLLKKEFLKNKAPIIDLIKAQTEDPFKILVGTILSARTKDDTTAEATRRLFKEVKNLKDLKKITESKLRKLIYPVGFYRVKAKHLKQLPATIERLFKGTIPQTIDELCELPGVGRKTANLVRAQAFNKSAICVDVHVHRISNRLGLIKTKTPFDTEMRLRKILPKRYWIKWNSYLVSFGQTKCRPINPQCQNCVILEYCYFGKKRKNDSRK